MIDRTKPPFSNVLPSFKFPSFEQERISDDIDIYFIPDKSLTLMNIRIVNALTNFRHRKEGLNFAIMNMLTKGTKQRKSMQIAEFSDSLGASLHSSVNWDECVFNLNILEKFCNKGLKVYKDCYFNSIFAEEEFERFKSRQISIIQQEEADLSYLAQSTFADLVGSEIYASTLIGKLDTVKSLEREECFDFYHQELLSSPKFIIVTGSYKKSEIIAYFKDFDFKSSVNSNQIDTIKPNGREKLPKSIQIEKPESQQTNLRIGFEIITSKHPDYPLLQLANTVFGGYFLSRLNENLREKAGLTYGVSSFLDSRKHESHLIIATSVSKEASKKAISEINIEINKMATQKVSEDELNRAKQYMLGTFARMNETTNQHAMMLEAILTNELTPDYYYNFFDVVKNADTSALFEIQQKYFKTDELITVAVG